MVATGWRLDPSRVQLLVVPRTICVLLGTEESETTVSVPVRVPTAVGVKVTVIVQDVGWTPIPDVCAAVTAALFTTCPTTVTGLPTTAHDGLLPAVVNTGIP